MGATVTTTNHDTTEHPANLAAMLDAKQIGRLARASEGGAR